MTFMGLLLNRVWHDTEAAVAINELEDGRLDVLGFTDAVVSSLIHHVERIGFYPSRVDALT